MRTIDTYDMKFREWFYREEMINRLDKTRGVGLTRDEMKVMATKSRGIVGIYDMIDMVKADPKRFLNSVYLGLSSYKSQVIFLMEFLTGMTRWRYAYKKLDVPMEEANTDEFLTKLTVSGAEIVFFLPNKLEKGVTRNEFDWLQSHPDSQGSVLYVVGGYDFFSSGEFEREFQQGQMSGGRNVKVANVRMHDAVGDHREMLGLAKNGGGKLNRYSLKKPHVQKLLGMGAIKIDTHENGLDHQVTVLDKKAVEEVAEELRQQGVAARQDMERPGMERLSGYVKDYAKYGGGHTDEPGWASSLV
jgi:hypothetical protein